MKLLAFVEIGKLYRVIEKYPGGSLNWLFKDSVIMVYSTEVGLISPGRITLYIIKVLETNGKHRLLKCTEKAWTRHFERLDR